MNIIAVIPVITAKESSIINLIKINNQYILEILYQNLKSMNIFQNIILSTQELKIKKLAKKLVMI